MKVKFSYPTRTMSGKEDDTVFGTYRNDNLCLARKYVYPEITEHNHEIGAVAKNLALVFHAISPTYAQDLKKYVVRNGKNPAFKAKTIPTSFAIFMKMMNNWLKSDPTHVNLSAVTVADIVALDAPVRTIKRAIEAGFLNSVSVYADLTAGIQ